MTLNLPLLYFVWTEEYCQTSPNKNKSPNLWHVTSILVCCIVDKSYTTPVTTNFVHKKQTWIYNFFWLDQIWMYPLMMWGENCFSASWFATIISNFFRHSRRGYRFFWWQTTTVQQVQGQRLLQVQPFLSLHSIYKVLLWIERLQS